MPPAEVAEQLGISSDTEVVVRRRLLHDEHDQVVEIGASYLSVAIAGGTFLEQRDVVPKALFLCVEDLAGKRYAYAHDHWIARLPSPTEADTLGISIGTPVLQVIHVASAEDDSILEVSESTWPADAVMLVDEYPITQDRDHSGAASDV